MEDFVARHGWLVGHYLAPLMVLGVTCYQQWLLHRRHPEAYARGGLLASLPFVIGPILLYIAINTAAISQPTLAARQAAALAAAAECARSALWGMLAYLAFCGTCAAVAPFLDRLLPRLCPPLERLLPRVATTVVTLLVGVLAFVLVGALLRLNPLRSPAWAVPIVLAALFLLRRALPAGAPRPHGPSPLRAWHEAALKFGLAGVICLLVIDLRTTRGDTLGGIVSIFPTATSVMVGGCLFTAGPAALRTQLRGITRGALGLLAFLTFTACLLPVWGTAPTLLCGFLLAGLVSWQANRVLR